MESRHCKNCEYGWTNMRVQTCTQCGSKEGYMFSEVKAENARLREAIEDLRGELVIHQMSSGMLINPKVEWRQEQTAKEPTRDG